MAYFTHNLQPFETIRIQPIYYPHLNYFVCVCHLIIIILYHTFHHPHNTQPRVDKDFANSISYTDLINIIARLYRL